MKDNAIFILLDTSFIKDHWDQVLSAFKRGMLNEATILNNKSI